MPARHGGVEGEHGSECIMKRRKASAKRALPPMNPMAEAIYEILRRRLSLGDPRITYADLARALRDESPAFERVTHRSQELYTALWEVGRACRGQRLPPLPALVVRADSRRPGDAYFDGLTLATRDERVAAWQEDYDAVRAATYPARGT